MELLNQDNFMVIELESHKLAITFGEDELVSDTVIVHHTTIVDLVTGEWRPHEAWVEYE